LDCLRIILSKVQDQHNFIESQRKAAIAPINETISQINTNFDNAQALLNYLIPRESESDEIIQFKRELVDQIGKLFLKTNTNKNNKP
jgi:hypothetical protein